MDTSASESSGSDGYSMNRYFVWTFGIPFHNAQNEKLAFVPRKSLSGVACDPEPDFLVKHERELSFVRTNTSRAS